MRGARERRTGAGARLVIALVVVLGAVVVLALLAVAVLVATGDGRLSAELPVRHTDSFDAVGIDLPALRTDGPDLVTDGGEVVELRGVMVPDLAVLADHGDFERELVEEIAATGANVVRVPVHPGHWSDDGDYLWRYLEPFARWCGEEGLYVILDWHSIGNVVTGEAPLMPDLYSHTMESTREFWTVVAGHFAAAPHVLLEIFNEPQGIRAEDWRLAAEELVDVVRAQGAEQPVIVGGVDYGRDLSWVASAPVRDPEVVYTTHIYPSHHEAGWDQWFGDVTDSAPLMVTEWGFMDENREADQSYLAGDAGYAMALLDRLADEGAAGWVACWWDDEWDPAMFRGPADDDDGAGGGDGGRLGPPTRWGELVLRELAD